MSKRRSAGDWVWLQSNAGFVGESNRLRAEIQPEYDDEEPPPCMFDCGDPDCREWTNLLTEPDPENDGQRWPLCHVSEYQMLEEP